MTVGVLLGLDCNVDVTTFPSDGLYNTPCVISRFVFVTGLSATDLGLSQGRCRHPESLCLGQFWQSGIRMR
jgi:hypothetical protein